MDMGRSVIVGDQGWLDRRARQPVVPDRGVEREQALDHAGPQPGGYPAAMVLGTGLALQRPDDRLGTLPQPVREVTRLLLVFAGRADQVQVQPGEVVFGVLSGQALAGDDGGAGPRAAGWLGVRHLPGLVPLAGQPGTGQAEPGDGAVRGDDEHQPGSPVKPAAGSAMAIAGVPGQVRALRGDGGLAARHRGAVHQPQHLRRPRRLLRQPPSPRRGTKRQKVATRSWMTPSDFTITRSSWSRLSPTGMTRRPGSLSWASKGSGMSGAAAATEMPA